MKIGKFLLTGVIVYVAYQVLNFLIHSLILSNMYMELAAIWRPEAEMNSVMWVMYVSDLIRIFLFVFIFTKGQENKGWMEGLRYGLLVGLLLSLGMSLNSYAIYPIPFTLAIYWLVLTTIQLMICGIVTALLYKPAK